MFAIVSHSLRLLLSYIRTRCLLAFAQLWQSAIHILSSYLEQRVLHTHPLEGVETKVLQKIHKVLRSSPDNCVC